MTDTRRAFLRNAGKVVAIAAVPLAVVTTSAQAAQPDLRGQLETVIHELRNPPPERICSSVLDDLKTANRLSEIIGVPVKAHGPYMDDRLVQMLEAEKARHAQISVRV